MTESINQLWFQTIVMEPMQEKEDTDSWNISTLCESMETTFCKERSLALELSVSSIQLDMAKVQRRRRNSLQFTPVHIMHKNNDLELYIKENVENCTESLISDRK